MLTGMVLADASTITVASLMASVADVFNTVIGQVATVATTIKGSPLLLLFALIPIVGIGVGLFKRLMNVN